MEHVVVKIHDVEKYAVCVCSGSKEECACKAAYFRGVFKDNHHVSFAIFPAEYIDSLQETESKGGASVYSTIKTL